jgi:hypothetical protein
VGEVLILTPVAPGQVESLRRYLDALPRDADPTAAAAPRPVPRSPFSGVLAPTHFARLVVVELEHRHHHLLFSSRFDGPVPDYLRALAATDTAVAIWSHCHLGVAGDDGPPDADALSDYLCDSSHQLPAQYVVSAFPAGVTVAEINAALSLRSQVSALAVRAARLDQWALTHEFRQLPAIRSLLGRPLPSRRALSRHLRGRHRLGRP